MGAPASRALSRPKSVSSVVVAGEFLLLCVSAKSTRSGGELPRFHLHDMWAFVAGSADREDGLVGVPGDSAAPQQDRGGQLPSAGCEQRPRGQQTIVDNLL